MRKQTVKGKNNLPTKKPKKAKKAPAPKKEESAEKIAYRKYIRSKDFQKVKDIVHKRDNDTCQFCGRTAEEIADSKITLQVHHRSYEHLGCADEREANDCILICSVCHRGAHSAISNLHRFSDKTKIFENIKERRRGE